MYITFTYSDTLERVKRRIEYVAGKRAETGDDFFRYKACSADDNLLREFIEAALASVRFALGIKCIAYSLTGDSIDFTLEKLVGGIESENVSLVAAIQNYIVEIVAGKWFAQMGIELMSPDLLQIQSYLETSSENLKNRKASSRKIPPI